MGRKRARWMGMIGIPLAVVLGGCTATSDPVPSPPAVSPSASGDAEASNLSAFEQQLPLSGEFVSQSATTEGTVNIERRSGGSVWVVFENFHTSAGTDLRLYLKEDALLQDANGFWGSSEDGCTIASVDPGSPAQEIEVPGAWDMPTIQSLTMRDYTPPDYPALGSVALESQKR